MAIPLYEEFIVDDVEVIDSNTGKISTEKLDKTYEDFMKYYKNNLELLRKVCCKLPSGRIKIKIIEELSKLD